MVERSAVGMARAVRERAVSAVELFDAHVARIAERDPLLAMANELEARLGGWLRP